MEIRDQNEQEPVAEPSEVDLLEDVRTTLAGDVVQFLAVATTITSDSDTTSKERSNSSSGQRQALLCAAVADLEAIDERLDNARL